MTRCDDLRLALGSYALGGLDPDQAAEVERHLNGCDACRTAYERLARLPALLDLVEPSQSPREHPSAPLEDAVLAGFRDARGERPAPRRTRRRFRLPQLRVALPSALVGAVLAVAALAIGGALSQAPEPVTTVTLRPPAGAANMSATARLTSGAAGTEVELDARLAPLRAGEVYELWFGREDGRVSAGTFTVDRDGRARLRLSAAARTGEHDQIGITREPDGLDPAGNGPAVVTGTLQG
jgi:Anti-sigma-K factor rskA/Putative zinc-finger